MSHQPNTRRLQARRSFEWRTLRDVWRYRELLFFFVWRDVKVRYTQTTLGVAWALVQPIVTMGVFSVFFGRLAGMPSDGVPYPLFSLCALVPWTYFASAVTSGSQSIVAQQHVLSKVYFPRVLIPLAAVLSPLVDFTIALAVLAVVMAGYGVMPGAAILWLPLLLALAILTAIAASLWLATLSARYRDVRYVIPFAMQIWLFATPVAYPASLVPEPWRALYGVNPMAGVVEGFRWALVGGPSPGVMTLVAALVVCLGGCGGLLYFGRVEGTFVDLL